MPDDWCYVYNFEKPNEPVAISLPAGQGKEFKNSMDGFIKEIKNLLKVPSFKDTPKKFYVEWSPHGETLKIDLNEEVI